MDPRPARHGAESWTIDLLPDGMAEPVAAMQEKGLAAMKETSERRA